MHAKTGKEKEDEEHFWKRQTNMIINVCITDTGAKSYIFNPLQSVLAVQEKGKGGNGMLGHEASMVLKQLSRKLAMNWELQPSKMANYIKTTMSLSLVRGIHGSLCESCVPSSSMGKHRWLCEDGAGIGLLQPYAN
eukprot:13970844-Ditylum_brightwellii.AAC.1